MDREDPQRALPRCNASPLSQPKGHEWLVLLDAAAFVPTNRLDLSAHKPDFVCISFYKLFGYPTGTGALLIRNKHVNDLRKLYWGGGTVQMVSELHRYNLFHVFRGCFGHA